MDPHTIADPMAWQESWDRQQEAYLSDREHRIAAMLDAVAAVAETEVPRVLDLAGGTGSITIRALARFPHAEVTLLDLDPVLLAIATASLAGTATIVTADLNRQDWVSALPHGRYDAVLTTTALHWLSPERVTALYREIRDILRPGGILINADHMPDDGLPTLTRRLTASAQARRAARYATGAVLSWQDWWQKVAATPELAPLVEQRARVYAGDHCAEWTPPVTWHLEALAAAGYAEVGVFWRGGPDAAVVGVR